MTRSPSLLRRMIPAAAVLGLLGSYGGSEAQTLDRIYDRGLVSCGLVYAGQGIAEVDADGRWTGFFPDLCRALSAAVLGDAEALEFVQVDFVTRFDALRDEAFDVLMSNTTWTIGRDVGLGIGFTSTTLYDGQGFLAHRSLGVERLGDLDGPGTVCVHSNTTTIENLQDVVRTQYPNLEIRAYESNEAGYDAFFARSCDLFTTDQSSLIGLRASRASDPMDFILLADLISREPLGPAVRQCDPEWFDIVQWVMYALVLAEEHGITSANVEDALGSEVPEVRRLFGLDDDFGAMMRLPRDWAYQAILQVGSYGEVFDRNLGQGSPLGMPRGLNDLWTRGGLIYAPPLR